MIGRSGRSEYLLICLSEKQVVRGALEETSRSLLKDRCNMAVTILLSY